MAAETKVITTDQIKKVREIDYAASFGEGLGKFLEILGVTRRLPVTAGTVLKQLKVTGTLENGQVDEGDIIPLSQYETTWESVGEVILNKYRKATTAEAILKGGFDQAVNETDKKMLLDIQKSVRARLVGALDNQNATTVSAGTLQEILAQIWGQLQIKFEDDSVEAVYFINPLDVADYLGSATITTQTAFGFTYIADFLGLGTVIVTPLITKGEIYGTAKNNIVDYYIDAREANGLGEAFDFSTDSETGFVGFHEESNYSRLQSETVAIEGVYIFPEMPAGIIKGTFTTTTPGTDAETTPGA